MFFGLRLPAGRAGWFKAPGHVSGVAVFTGCARSEAGRGDLRQSQFCHQIARLPGISLLQQS
jgi:hypothetical protein